MNETERAEIERACERLSIAYAHHVDFRAYDRFAELFADDGLLDVGTPMHGKAAIARGMSRRSDRLRSRHVLTNILIAVVDADHATGISYLTLYRHIGDESLQYDKPVSFKHPAAVGHYSDTFIRTDQGWRFASRKLEFAFSNAELFPRQ